MVIFQKVLYSPHTVLYIRSSLSLDFYIVWRNKKASIKTALYCKSFDDPQFIQLYLLTDLEQCRWRSQDIDTVHQSNHRHTDTHYTDICRGLSRFHPHQSDTCAGYSCSKVRIHSVRAESDCRSYNDNLTK